MCKYYKVLEIIKKYNIRPSDFLLHSTYREYLYFIKFITDDEDKIMCEEEFNLLKEVLL